MVNILLRIAHILSGEHLTRTEKASCQWTNLATVRSAPTQRDELAGRQSVRERCVGVQADSARNQPTAAQ